MSAARGVSASTYVRAGNTAADAAIGAIRAARRNSPNMGDIVIEGQKQRAQTKAVALKAEADIHNAGIRKEAAVRKARVQADRDKSLAKSKATVRKAGKIAAAGTLIGDSITEGRNTRERRDLLARMEAKSEKRHAERQKQHAELIEQLKSRNTGSDDSIPVTVTPASIGLDVSSPPKPNEEVASASGVTSPDSPVSQGIGSSEGWERLSRVIRFGEGTTGSRGYNTQFTGTQFDDLSAHPRQKKTNGRYTSDAAGAYQFLSTTWDGAKKALNLPDFSISSQEKAGRYLTEQRGVNPDMVFKSKSEFKAAMDKLAPEWASLPYSGVSPGGYGKGSSYYGQGGKSVDELWDLYNK